jgi:hypothetical protein
MKLIFISILFVIFGDATFTEVNINRKRLNKEVENRFQLTGYDLRKMEFSSAAPGETENGIFWNIEYKNETVGFVYTGRVFSCSKNGCTVGQTSISGENAEFFDYFILFDKTKSVISVVVYNYEATHGQEITAKGWLKQFAGYNGSRNLVVGKNIDSISGATISVNAITTDIALKTGLLKNLN